MDNLEFDEARGGYVAAAGTKVAAPFSLLHLAMKVQTGLFDLHPPGFYVLYSAG